MMNWWLDRGVDGFRMDVINLISKDTALPDGLVHEGALHGDGWPFFVCGPRIHEFLQEMFREVFEGRDPLPLTVGEMPGVTIEQARQFTDPARQELDMVFQFEHMGLDGGPLRHDSPRPARPQGHVRALAGRPRRRRLEQPLLGQPRPAARRVAVRRRRPRAPGGLGAVPGHGAAPAPRDAVRLPGRRARHDQRAVRGDRRLPRHRVAEPLRRGRRLPARDPETVLATLRVKSRDNARTPVQWDTSDQAGFTTGTPWIAVNPNFTTINAEAERAEPGLGLPPLPPTDRAPPRRARRGPRHFTMLLGRRPVDLRLHAGADGVELLVVCNVSSEPVEVTIPDAERWAEAELVLRTPAVSAWQPGGWAPPTLGGEILRRVL